MTGPSECNVVLSDGTTVRLRPAVPSDAGSLKAFFDRLSSDTVELRYFGLRRPDAKDIDRLLTADPANKLALIAESGGAVVALAQLERDGPGSSSAEAAFLVTDAMQGHGVGTRLLERLAVYARRHNIRTFHCWVLAQNQRMLRVLRDSGFAARSKTDHGVIDVTLSLDETPPHTELNVGARTPQSGQPW